MPLPVEPMKALADLAVAGGLCAVLAVASGLFAAFPMALLEVLLVGVGALATNVVAAFPTGAVWWLARTRDFR